MQHVHADIKNTYKHKIFKPCTQLQYTIFHVSLRYISLICLYVEMIACFVAFVGNVDFLTKLTF